MDMTLANVGIALLCVAIAVLLLYPRGEGFAVPIDLGGLNDPRRVFAAGQTSKSLYQLGSAKNDAQFYRSLRERAPLLDDRDDLLTMNRCMTMKYVNDANWNSSIRKVAADADIFVDLAEVTTSDFQVVRARIVDSMQKRVDANAGVQLPGPVYVMLGQAPYYRDAEGRTISVQFNADTYGMDYYNREAQGSPPTIVVKVAVIFPMLTHKGAYAPNRKWSDVVCKLGWLLKSRSKETGCFLTCPGDRTMFCGCLNQSSPYESRCLGPSTRKDKVKGTPMDHVLVYTVSSTHKMLQPNSVSPWQVPRGCAQTRRAPPSREVATRRPWLLGVGMDNQLYTCASATAPWVLVPKSGSVTKAICLREGGIVGIGLDRQIYVRESLYAPWVKSSTHSCCVISVCELRDGRLLGVGTDNKLYATKASWRREGLGWTPVSHDNSCCVVDIAALKNGNIVGVGTDKQLWIRASMTSAWTLAAQNTCCVTSVTTMPDGSLLGVGLDSKLWRKTEITGPWLALGQHTCCVKSVSPVPAKLNVDGAPTTTTASNVAGRYVRLQRKTWPPNGGQGQGYINILEFAAYGPNGERLTASPSLWPPYGNSNSFGAHFLIRPKGGGGLPHTTNDPSAYMELDLQQMQEVSTIMIENRRDCCTSRILGTELQVLDASRRVVWSTMIQSDMPTYRFTPTRT